MNSLWQKIEELLDYVSTVKILFSDLTIIFYVFMLIEQELHRMVFIYFLNILTELINSLFMMGVTFSPLLQR